MPLIPPRPLQLLPLLVAPMCWYLDSASWFPQGIRHESPHSGYQTKQPLKQASVATTSSSKDHFPLASWTPRCNAGKNALHNSKSFLTAAGTFNFPAFGCPLRYSNRRDMNNRPGLTHMAMKLSFPIKLSTSFLITSLLSSHSVSKPMHSDTLLPVAPPLSGVWCQNRYPRNSSLCGGLLPYSQPPLLPWKQWFPVMWRNRFRLDPNTWLSPCHPDTPPDRKHAISWCTPWP